MPRPVDGPHALATRAFLKTAPCPSFILPTRVTWVELAGTHIESTNNNNYGQFNDPAINRQMAAAELVVGTQARAEAWAKIDRELVAQAAAIPFAWDKQPNIESKDVAGVGDVWNLGVWDYSFTSLK